MIILIDAYNFIKTITGQTFISERLIDEWIDTFNEYVRTRHNEVILVFDAGPGFYSSVILKGSVSVLYAGHSRTADDLIKDWLSKHEQKDILLVTSDRELCTYADAKNITSVGSDDFYRIFNHVMKQEDSFEQKVAQTLHKIEQPGIDLSFKHDTVELDKLMEHASRGLIRGQIKKEQDMPLQVRGGKKASKMDKRLMRKINKI